MSPASYDFIFIHGWTKLSWPSSPLLFPIKKLKQCAGVKNITFSIFETRQRSDHQTVGHPGHSVKFSRIFYGGPQEGSKKNR